MSLRQTRTVASYKKNPQIEDKTPDLRPQTSIRTMENRLGIPQINQFRGRIRPPSRKLNMLGGTPTIGKLKITAGNANTLMLTWDFPAKLVMGDHEIVYRRSFYAHSRNEDGPWDRLSFERRLTLPYDGVEAAGTHYFQYGGEILISHDTEPGHYTNTMTLSVSCPE